MYQNKLNHHIERNFGELEDFLIHQSKLGSLCIPSSEFRRFRVSESLGYSLNSSITAKLMINYMKFTKVLHLHQNTNKCNCKCRNLLINTVGKFAFGQL